MPTPVTVLSEEQWLARARGHSGRAGAYTTPYLARRSSQARHPVEDFLFTYYSQKPGQLLRWHPGAGVVLTGPAAAERASWKYYRHLEHQERESLGIVDDDAVAVDVESFLTTRREAVEFARVILSGTAARPANLSCFGLHEWAMAYKSEQNGVRHNYLKLRLGAGGTDGVVERSRIRCTHFDAFRFYTPEAVELNELQPSRGNQSSMEQPGCLHANMDLYKWAYKLVPLLPSELVMDCFELSWRIRRMDMQASPYDLSDWGYEPIRIETPEGRAEYARIQRSFTAESQQLRAQLIQYLEGLNS